MKHISNFLEKYNNKKITVTIDTRCTPFTCDTYSMFTGDSFDEMYIDDQREQLNDDSLIYDSFNWDYNFNGIIKSIGTIASEFIADSFEFINTAVVKDVYSPKYYNYTTDSVDIEITCDIEKIKNYCLKNNDWHNIDKINIDDGFIYEINGFFIKDINEAMVLFYINTETERMKKDLEGDIQNDYEYRVYDCLYEIYSDNTTVNIIKK